MLFLHAAHHHAQVTRLNHYTYTLGLDGVLNGLRNLHCQALLDLQTAGKDIDQAGNLAQSQDFAIRNISHVDFAKEWQQMLDSADLRTERIEPRGTTCYVKAHKPSA